MTERPKPTSLIIEVRTVWEAGYDAGFEAGLMAVGDAKSIVLHFIKNNPGKRGIEIVKALGLKSSSIRAAICRLRDDEAIVKWGKGWVVAGARQ